MPIEPSKKIVWSVRRSIDAIAKVQHRMMYKMNKILHALSLNGLLILGTVVDLFEWVFVCYVFRLMDCTMLYSLLQVQLNWNEMMLIGLPAHLNKMANAYRKSSGVDTRPANAIEDVVFLSSYLVNRTVELIRGALSVITGLADSQLVRSLHLQLSIALAVSLDFLTRIIRVSGNHSHNLDYS